MPDRVDGGAYFAVNCAAGHGAFAQADGVLAAELPQTPADLTTVSQRDGDPFPTVRAPRFFYRDPEQDHLA